MPIICPHTHQSKHVFTEQENIAYQQCSECYGLIQFCPHCSRANRLLAHFCVECGHKLNLPNLIPSKLLRPGEIRQAAQAPSHYSLDSAFSVAISRLSRSREQDLLRRIQSDVVNAINDMNEENLRKWTALLSFHAGGGEKASYYSRRFPKKHVVRAIFLQEAQSLITMNGDRMKSTAQTALKK